MNNQEIAIVGLSVLVFWLCWVIRGAVLSSRDKSKEFALLQDTCDTWRETATRRAGELTEAWKQLKDFREKAEKWDQFRREQEAARESVQSRIDEYILSPVIGVSGNVAEALIPTGDSIENAISHPDKNRFFENETVFEKRDRFLGNQVEAALAHAEDRSNNYG